MKSAGVSQVVERARSVRRDRTKAKERKALTRLTGTRRIIDYLLSLIAKATNEAGSGR